jgi:CysZ protein
MLSAISGFFLPFQGLRLVLRPGLRRFVIVPILANVAVFGALVYFGAHYFDTFMNAWLPSHEWLQFLRWLFWVVFALVYALAVFFGFTMIANLIAAPFNGILAARVEERLTGRRPPADDSSLLRSIIPALAAEIGKILYFLSRALPLGILFLIPGVNVIAGAAWLLFGFWFLAVEYADYAMANHNLKPTQQRKRLRRRRYKALAFGAGVTAMMLIPVLQFAAMPAAVAGAARLWADDLKDLEEPA